MYHEGDGPDDVETDDRTDYSQLSPRRRGVVEGRRRRSEPREGRLITKPPVLWMEIENLERAVALLAESIEVLENKLDPIMSPEMADDSIAMDRESKDDHSKLARSITNQTERLHFLRRKVEELSERVQL